jgi:hypothetical protein
MDRLWVHSITWRVAVTIPIIVIEENRFTPVAADGDVVDRTGEFKAKRTSHQIGLLQQT